MAKKQKLKAAFHWLASCGGCEVAVLDIDEMILDVVKLMDIKFWPVALDSKYADVKAWPDNYLDLAFINGGVRTTEQEEHAKLFRAKSKVVIAFGACAAEGGIPGLANATSREAIFQTVYHNTASTENPEGIRPQAETELDGVTYTLPTLHDQVRALDQIIQVDYYLPGCPPPVPLIANAVKAIAEGKLPPPPAVLAPEHSLCDECSRTRSRDTRRVERFVRPHLERPADPEQCLLEQGIICMGPVTRGGCGAQCISVNMGCRGCGGPTPEVTDQGLKFVSTLGTLLKGDTDEDAAAAVDSIADPLGTLYRYSLPHSLLRKATEEVSE